MDLVANLQGLLGLVLVAFTAFFVVDGLRTGSVWVKGGRGLGEMGTWAHKRHREEEPVSYWIAIVFYTVGCGVGIYLAIRSFFR